MVPESIINFHEILPNQEINIVPPAAATDDFALIFLRNTVPLPLKRLLLWQSSTSELTLALKRAQRRITQAGYRADHLDLLYSHQNF